MPKQEKQGFFAAIRNFFFGSASKKRENISSSGASSVTRSTNFSVESGFYEEPRPAVPFVLPPTERSNPLYDGDEYEVPVVEGQYYTAPLASNNVSYAIPYEGDAQQQYAGLNQFYLAGDSGNESSQYGSAQPIYGQEAAEGFYSLNNGGSGFYESNTDTYAQVGSAGGRLPHYSSSISAANAPENSGFYAVPIKSHYNDSYPLYNNSRIEQDSLNSLSSDQRSFYTQNSGPASLDNTIFSIPYEEENYDYNHLAGWRGQEQGGGFKAALSNAELIEEGLYGYANKRPSTGAENHPGRDLSHPGRTSFEAENVAAGRKVQGSHREYEEVLRQEKATSEKIYGKQSTTGFVTRS